MKLSFRSPTLGLVLLPLILLVGCSTGSWRRSEAISRSNQLVVEVEGRIVEGAPESQGFEHPANISAERLQACLANIRYESASLLQDSEPPAVINDRLAPGVAAGIAQGLARASDSQRVRFRVYNPDTTLWVLPGEVITRGVAFVRPEGTFNIAFDLVCATPDRESGEDFDDWKDPVRWVQSGGSLILSGGARLHVTSEGKTKKLWVEFPIGPGGPVDPDAINGTPEKEPGKTPAGGMPVPTGSTGGPSPTAANPGTQPGSTKSASPPPTVGPTVKKEPVQDLTDSAILERLRYLEELNRKGLLSDEEYTKERAQLLERDD